MSTNDMNRSTETKHSDPISIPTSARGRARSMSVSSASSGSSSELPTPPSGSANSNKFQIPSPSSPILSYFLAQSPTTKTPATAFPFKRKFGGTVPVFEVEEETEPELPATMHARRASANVANRLSQQGPPTTYSDANNDRGTNLLRRLSLSSAAFAKPQLDQANRNKSPPSPPPNSAVSPTSATAPFMTKPRRSATISNEGARPRRAPSPMGERILKGHFDGFN